MDQTGIDMTTVEQLRTLLDEASGGVFWSDTHIYNALNEAQLAMLSLHPNARVGVSFLVPEGASYIPLPISLLMIPQSIEDADRSYVMTSHSNLERYSRGWRGAALNVPQLFVKWGTDFVKPYPRADQDYLYTLWGVPWPTEISATTTTLVLPYHLAKAIIYRAASSLLDFTQPQLSQLWERESERELNDHARTQRNQHSHNIRRLQPLGRTRLKGGDIDKGLNWN